MLGVRNRLTKLLNPFVLSLSKDMLVTVGKGYFDKLSTNGSRRLHSPELTE